MAGPGAGKSTAAARLFGELKTKGYDVEHVSEYIKTWAYEGRKPQSFDQFYIFAKQLKSEDVVLRKAKHIVSDSPILLNTAYSTFYGCSFSSELISIAKQFEVQYPSLNLIIERSVEYVDKGRYQNFQEAIEFDEFLFKFLEEHLPFPTYKVKVQNFASIMQLVEQQLNVG
jgi:hypothetical protein